MTSEERVQAVAKLGFTERQARFLVTVMRHSGVCMLRQYCAFAGIVHGQKTRKFFAKLVRLKCVTTYDCAHNRARIYHVQHKALYRAIGEPESYLRRPTALARAVERLMLLDAIVESPELVWLANVEEKATHVTALSAIAPERLPHITVGERDDRRTRCFPDRMPLGIHPEGRAVLVCLVTDPVLDDLRAFLQRHFALLRALRAWTVRILVPPHLQAIAERAEGVAREQLTSPLSSAMVDELRWYFEQCRAVPATTVPRLEPRFYRDRRAFESARYQLLYRAWKQDGETVLVEASSPAIADAIGRGAGRIETRVLGHGYGHLSRLSNTA